MASMLTLLLVLTPLGRTVQGAQRWIDLGVLGQFQPAELAKVAVIVVLPGLLALRPRALRWDSIVRAVVVVAIPAMLIFLQPDLGTMLSFGIIAMVILFVAGASWRQMAALIIAATVGAVALFQVGAIRAYQVERLTAFLDVNSDVLGAQYNLQQSEIAIGTGGLFGKGLSTGPKPTSGSCRSSRVTSSSLRLGSSLDSWGRSSCSCCLPSFYGGSWALRCTLGTASVSSSRWAPPH